jgi:DNA-binding NarL/FixJ family response regulator
VNPLRVLIADDDDVFRSALADFIRDHDSMEVVAEAADAGGAIALASELKPDIALVDVKMPGGGAEACAGIRASSPATHVLVLSAHGDPQTARQMLAAGASRHLVKGASSSDLTAQILAVAATRASPF